MEKPRKEKPRMEIPRMEIPRISRKGNYDVGGNEVEYSIAISIFTSSAISTLSSFYYS